MAGLLVVCGLGCEPERDATLEALAALTSCAERYAVLSPGRRAWLARRVGTVKTAKNAAAVARAARGRVVGLAVWGHATVTSEFAREALAAAKKMGVETVVLASLSPAGHALGASARSLGWRKDEDDGWSVLPYGEVPQARLSRPLAVFDAGAESVMILFPEKRRA